MIPEPPDELSEVGARVWRRVLARSLALGIWEPIDELALLQLARSVHRYVQMRGVIRRLSPEQSELLSEGMRGCHANTREWMQCFMLIRPERVPLAPLDENGDDAEIMALASE